MKKKLKFSIITIIIIAALIGYWQLKKGKNTMSWRTLPASVRTVTVNITATGTLTPVTQVNVGTEVSGKIERIYKDFNDTVRRGELLAKLDTTTLQMALEDSRIELRKSQLTANENLIDLNSARELFEQNFISQHELQRSQYSYDVSLENVEKARFSVRRAETNLNNAMIYSPIDGVIISRAVDEGQTVAASLNAPTLFIIANSLEEMQIEAQIDEADIGRVRNDMRARFSIDAFPDQSFFGRVRQIRLNPIVEQNVVSYKVIISVSNENRLIMPGMTANVEIIVDQKRDVLTISERALQFRPSKEIWEAFRLPWDDSLAPATRVTAMGGGGRGSGSGGGEGRGRGQGQQPTAVEIPRVNVWVLVDDKPVQRSIEVGISDGANLEVISGIEVDEQIIIGVNQNNIPGAAAANPFGGQQGGMRVMVR
jgi:HlyD family secretion protein